MSKKQYWIDADGYLVYGYREVNKWKTVAEMPQEHVEPLARILYNFDDLLEACKAALEFFVQWDIQQKGVSGLSLQLNEAITKVEKKAEDETT